MDVEELISVASEIQADALLDLIMKVKDILLREKREGVINEMKIDGGLVFLPSEGNAIVVGDLHGDFESLATILDRSNALQTKPYIIFLGDYGDRGRQSVEVLNTILKLKDAFSSRVVPLKGNHEKPPVYPHDLPLNFDEKYGSKGAEIYNEMQLLFDILNHAVIVEGKYIMLHGGLPEKVTSVKDITYPSEDILEQILWSDPAEIDGVMPSPRGAGKLFGETVTFNVLQALEVKILIRSHQPCEGVSVNHGGKVLTLFSRKGYPYFNHNRAYLEIDLSANVEDAYTLAKKAHIF